MTVRGTNRRTLRKAIDHLLATGKGEMAIEVELALRDIERLEQRVQELELHLETATNNYWAKS